MNTIVYSKVFTSWIDGLRDQRGRALILARLQSVMQGNLGDFKYIAEGVYEFRVHFGPGYRVYFMRSERCLYLLVGGIKATQARDVNLSLGIKRQIESKGHL